MSDFFYIFIIVCIAVVATIACIRAVRSAKAIQLIANSPKEINDVCIVSMMRNPEGFEQWLSHHKAIGVSKFYILDDHSDASFFSSHHNDSCVIIEESQETHEEGNINQIIKIQERFVTKTLKNIKRNSIVFHIDSDEFIEDINMSENFNLPERLSQCIKPDIDVFLFKNREARYPENSRELFHVSEFKNCWNKGHECGSYGNGKSAARVTRGSKCPKPMGVHFFFPENERIQIMEDIVIHHCESPTFESFYSKYKQCNRQTYGLPLSVEAKKLAEKTEFENLYKKWRICNKDIIWKPRT